VKRLIFILILATISAIPLVYSEIAASDSLKHKIDLAFKKQEEIENKLKEVEVLVNQVRIRVYRKTGFYGR
jgi:hypothetical protein